MSPEWSAFLSANGTALILVAGFLASVGLVQWRKVRVAEREADLKQAMLDRGVPVEEIEKAVAAKPPARRGWIEQFGALPGGAKAGVLVGGVIVFVVGVGCLTGLLSSIVYVARAGQHVSAPPQAAPPVPPVEKSDAITGHAYYLDLQPLANQKLTDVTGEGHSLAALPQRRREFGGVPFQVGPGFVRLRGKNRPELPAEAAGVRVGFAFDRLHVLHAAEYGAFGGASHRFHVADGTEVARYRVRYADGAEVGVPVVYGEDVRDAWNWDGSRKATRGKVVWTGTSPGASKEGVSLRLYLTTWANPRPAAEVAGIDIVSACDTAASPFCVAMTAEREVR
jgi:hypothetical protein